MKCVGELLIVCMNTCNLHFHLCIDCVPLSCCTQIYFLVKSKFDCGFSVVCTTPTTRTRTHTSRPQLWLSPLHKSCKAAQAGVVSRQEEICWSGLSLWTNTTFSSSRPVIETSFCVNSTRGPRVKKKRYLFLWPSDRYSLFYAIVLIEIKTRCISDFNIICSLEIPL